MYGEDHGTATLAGSLVELAVAVCDDIDNGTEDAETLEHVRWIMEGAFVLMGTLADWGTNGGMCPHCGKPIRGHGDGV